MESVFISKQASSGSKLSRGCMNSFWVTVRLSLLLIAFRHESFNAWSVKGKMEGARKVERIKQRQPDRSRRLWCWTQIWDWDTRLTFISVDMRIVHPRKCQSRQHQERYLCFVLVGRKNKYTHPSTPTEVISSIRARGALIDAHTPMFVCLSRSHMHWHFSGVIISSFMSADYSYILTFYCDTFSLPLASFNDISLCLAILFHCLLLRTLLKSFIFSQKSPFYHFFSDRYLVCVFKALRDLFDTCTKSELLWYFFLCCDNVQYYSTLESRRKTNTVYIHVQIMCTQAVFFDSGRLTSFRKMWGQAGWPKMLKINYVCVIWIIWSTLVINLHVGRALAL